MAPDALERAVYAAICQSDGIKAKEIAHAVGAERKIINHYLYCSPFMSELCFRDRHYLWHGLIRQKRPHTGLGVFCGYYNSARCFMDTDEETWFESLLEGCKGIGRNLNDTRGLFHSFRDTGSVMRSLFKDLDGIVWDDWEIAFELRIRRSKGIRIYADVLVVTERYVFSLEFKMKDVIEEKEILQAAKYSSYLEVIFGPEYEIIPVLVLTGARDLYIYREIGSSTALLPVCSGDMLFNVFDEYIGFLEK